MKPLRRKRPPTKATATVHFRHAKNEKGNKQICVYAECDIGGMVVGPIWGHSELAVRKAMVELTHSCDCPAKFHKAQDYHGLRISKSTRRKT